MVFLLRCHILHLLVAELHIEETARPEQEEQAHQPVGEDVPEVGQLWKEADQHDFGETEQEAAQKSARDAADAADHRADEALEARDHTDERIKRWIAEAPQ